LLAAIRYPIDPGHLDAQEEIIQIIASTLIVALPTFSTPLSGSAQQTRAPAGSDATIDVRLSSFAFHPENLRLKAGVPLRLRLVNDGSGA
jgi:hypothetical protein